MDLIKTSSPIAAVAYPVTLTSSLRRWRVFVRLTSPLVKVVIVNNFLNKM
jgi:hypothetical protein